MTDQQKLEAAARDVVDAYYARFKSNPGRLFGPIDEEIIALKKLLPKGEN